MVFEYLVYRTMMLSPVQVCMDSTDWSQGMMQERGFRPSGEDLLSCSRPLLERRLKPQPEQALKCPRCESTNTKFCYYNNYSLSQPRHFCKTCRRYWTKGGTLRTVPVGGGCRKNKRAKRSVAADQPVFSTQSEPSTSGAPSASALPIGLDHQADLNPATNSSSYFNLAANNTPASTEANLAFARMQQAARQGGRSVLPNCNNSDFLGLSCGSSTQSSFGPQNSLNNLNPISSLTNLSALSALNSLKFSFAGLEDFHGNSNRSDQGSLAVPSEWQLPSETTLFEQAGDSTNYWSGGAWGDLTSYGSSVSPQI